jgi:hypothetical protein
MDREKFEHELRKAQTMGKLGDKTDYWQGYQRGLRRRFHGDTFGTDEEHELWMDLIHDPDLTRAERGRGYRDGYHGKG